MSTVYTPFHEDTYDQEGDYLADVDFDDINEKICVNEYSNVKVYKVDCDGLYSKDVSTEIPYCYLRIHQCCPVHRAYTTTTVPLKFQMDKKFIHTDSNELKMREGFLPFFNCYLMSHFKSVYFK